MNVVATLGVAGRDPWGRDKATDAVTDAMVDRGRCLVKDMLYYFSWWYHPEDFLMSGAS